MFTLVWETEPRDVQRAAQRAFALQREEHFRRAAVQREEHGTLHRATNAAMGRLLERARAAQAVSSGERPTFPKRQAFSTPQAWERACEQVRRLGVKGEVRPPWWKLDTSDGWLLTPSEIAELLRRLGNPAGDPVFAWLAVAAEHDGARVF